MKLPVDPALRGKVRRIQAGAALQGLLPAHLDWLDNTVAPLVAAA